MKNKTRMLEYIKDDQIYKKRKKKHIQSYINNILLKIEK